MASFKDIIAKKRDGGALSEDEWRRVVADVVAGTVPDYQIAALLMAVYLRGLTEEELRALVVSTANSGERLYFPGDRYVDKHSTGGVGDIVTLVVVPWVAACGARVPKLSGRGLGHTGGTIDKLAAIPGLSTKLDTDTFKRQVEEVGCAIAEAATLAPADKKFYVIRDATATVSSRPLIVASILSKKLAGGARAIVFDVKCGQGAFVAAEEEARALAADLISGARAHGLKASAVISAMDEPLGNAVGNALEVKAALNTLRGEGPADVLEVSTAVASEMLILAGVARRGEAQALLKEKLESGAAFAKFDEMVRAQGAPAGWQDKLPAARYAEDIKAESEGVIIKMDAYKIARAAAALGAGREKVEDTVDPAAGVILRKKVGDAVTAGETILSLYYNDPKLLPSAVVYAREAIEVGKQVIKSSIIIDLLV